MKAASRTKAVSLNEWHWMINLEGLVGRNVWLETVDGIQREGKISGAKYKELTISDRGIEYADVKCMLPVHIELNGDVNDFIEFQRIRTFELR